MKIPIITGPTASGKSSLVYETALELGNIDIISADAFQVYKHFDIGTAKPSLLERELVPHHLVDIMEPDESYSAGKFADSAELLIESIIKAGRYPVIAGGTGLYVRSLTDGIFNCPEISVEYREELQKRAEKDGLLSLYNELMKVDAEYGRKISSNDPVRIIRALEVYNGLGITFTEAHKLYMKKPKYEYFVVMLGMERSRLYSRINERTLVMMNEGWKSEVEKILNMGYSVNCPAFRAIGYRDIADYILNGGDWGNVVAKISKETRNFAKRQLTWFRHTENIIIYEDRDVLKNNLIEYIKGNRDNL